MRALGSVYHTMRALGMLRTRVRLVLLAGVSARRLRMKDLPLIKMTNRSCTTTHHGHSNEQHMVSAAAGTSTQTQQARAGVCGTYNVLNGQHQRQNVRLVEVGKGVIPNDKDVSVCVCVGKRNHVTLCVEDSATSRAVGHPPYLLRTSLKPSSLPSWLEPMMNAAATVKPLRTGWERKLTRKPALRKPRMTWMTPVIKARIIDTCTKRSVSGTMPSSETAALESRDTCSVLCVLTVSRDMHLVTWQSCNQSPTIATGPTASCGAVLKKG